MTSWVVADSGILIASVLLEAHTERAKHLLRLWKQEDVQIAAPTLFRYEIISVMRKSVHRNMFTPEEAVQGREILMEYPVQIMMDDDLLRRGYDLATLYNRPTAYDAHYLTVAERLQCDFWTVDERLYNAVSKDLDWVKWIGNLPIQETDDSEQPGTEDR